MGGKPTLFGTIEGMDLVFSVPMQSQGDAQSPYLSIGEKTINTLLNGKLLSDDEKRKLIERVTQGVIPAVGSKPVPFQGDEADANARLIAAAPELLDLVMLVHGSFGGGPVITFSDDDIAAFEAAIAKATGGSNA
eukprot:jgi/Tetstr1/450614/TSEL_037650.t1